MSNRGVSPVDVLTDVGLFRSNVGDINSVPLSPPEAGFADYEWFSDAELESYLLRAGGNLSRAQGYLVLNLSLNIALVSEKSIKTDDLAIDKKGGSKSLLEIAKEWFDRADDEDAATIAGDSYFVTTPFVGGYRTTVLP